MKTTNCARNGVKVIVCIKTTFTKLTDEKILTASCYLQSGLKFTLKKPIVLHHFREGVAAIWSAPRTYPTGILQNLLGHQSLKVWIKNIHHWLKETTISVAKLLVFALNSRVCE